MSDNTHRGPWSLHEHDNYINDDDVKPLMILDCDGEVVACNSTFYPTELQEKHAHMMAAAPDLYEALKIAQLWLDIDGRYDMQAINVALAKARGET